MSKGGSCKLDVEVSPFEGAILLQKHQEGIHVATEPKITEGYVRESPEVVQ